MSKIYTGIDLGSHSIKIVVANKIDETYHVLAASSSKSVGIKKGLVQDIKQASTALKDAVTKTESMLGVPLKKAVLCVPTDGLEITIVTGKTEVENPNEVTGEDISNVLKVALSGKIHEERELITALPIYFTIGEEMVKDPKGMPGDFLEVKAVIATVRKESLYRLLEVVRLAGLETVDIAFHATGDYFEARNSNLDKQVGAIVNIGEDETVVSVFNKGIMIKSCNLAIGSHYVDKDISYIFHTEVEKSRQLKENFATAVVRYADNNDVAEIEVDDGTTKEIKQTELSKVVESRVYEILKLVKKELKILTNREIRYIIITGGLSELAGFQYAVEDILGREARVLNMTTMGVRHNKYSSVLGLLKYYDDKLSLRGKSISMFTTADIELLLAEKKQEITSDHIISKVFGHFFDN